jgi:hypothetical protein
MSNKRSFFSLLETIDDGKNAKEATTAGRKGFLLFWKAA